MSSHGPAYLPKKFSEAVSTTLVVDPASRLSPCGRDGPVQCASPPVVVPYPAPADQVVEEDQRDDDERDGIDDLAGPGTGGREIALEERCRDSHEQRDPDGDRQVPEPGGDDGGERRGDEQW